MRSTQKLAITLQVTSEEVEAIQLAIKYYTKFFHRPTPEYRKTEQLLLQLHERMAVPMPATPLVLRGIKL
jgi:hypothetical protein